MTHDLVHDDPWRGWGWWLALPVVLLAAYLLAMLTLPERVVTWLRSESGPMEWGQAACFFAAGAIAVWLAFRAREAAGWARAFYLLFGLAGLVVTGEELSWGQHLFNFETPTTLSELNKQDEANLHNLWDDLPSRLMRRFLEIGLPLLCIAVPVGLLIKRAGYVRGAWTWYTLPRLEMVPSLLIAALGRPFKASDDWGWPMRWHDSASEFAEVFWAYALVVWIAVLARRVGRGAGRSGDPADGTESMGHAKQPATEPRRPADPSS